MNNLSTIYDNICELNSHDKYDASYKLIKLMEECGEVSEAFLKSKGYKKSTDDIEQSKENILEECSDVFIMIMSILNDNGNSIDEITEMIDKKCDKWKREYLQQQ